MRVIWVVIGTRPEAIKMAPVARALAARDLAPTIVWTGQHSDLKPEDHGLGEFAIVELHCSGDEDPHRHVRSVCAAMLPRLRQSPDLLIAQGDTSSALGAALAASIAGVPLAHVEAGLRSHDLSQPWPEEEYRCAIDACAELLFAPTARAARNLESESVGGEIHITGNTGVDAVLAAEALLPAPRLREIGCPRLLVTCHRRESWSEGLGSIADACRRIGRDGTAVIDFVLHPNRHIAQRMRAALEGAPGVSLIAPCSHSRLVERMRSATLLLSDSGGLQEEAPALGVPLLVLRDKTERPEGIESGNARLVGTEADRIVEEVQRLLADPILLAAMSRRALPYGDGRASERIAAIIENWLQRRDVSERVRRKLSTLGR